MKMTVPTFVILPRKTKADKKIHLNINTYRNLNHMVNNQCKKVFYEAFRPELIKWKKEYGYLLDYNKSMFKMKLHYTITAANKRKFDVSNILSIVDKFAADCLVKEGFLVDDNWEYLSGAEYTFGGVTGERTCTLQILTI